MRAGGAGCISATSNVNPAAIDRLFRHWRSDDAELLQTSLDAVRLVVQQFPLVPALKTIVSHYSRDPEWNRLRPPLVELSEADSRKLISQLERVAFEMPGLTAPPSSAARVR
jgi:4-hydroxy-tetrahydrodipicolinate synthase